MAGRKGRRGWGRIRQLPNKGKRYQASYVWPPQTEARHNALTTFSTRALAEQWLADERRLIERGQWSPPMDRMRREVIRAQTFGDYAAQWIEERDLKESSRKEYRRLRTSFLADALGPLPLHALDTLEIATRFYDGGAAAWSTELRYRERVLGTTHDARQGMRIRYVTAIAPANLSVIAVDDQYRDL